MIDTPPETTLIAPETVPLPSPTINPAPAPVEVPKDPKRSLYVTHTVVKGDTL